MIRSPSATRTPTAEKLGCAPWPPRSSSGASCSTFCPRAGSRSATMASSVLASGSGSTDCDSGWAACRLPSACHPSSLLTPGTRRRLTGPCQRSRLRAVQPVVRPYNGCNGSGSAVAVLLDLYRLSFAYSSIVAEPACQRGGLHTATRMPNLVCQTAAAMIGRPPDTPSAECRKATCLLPPDSTRIYLENAGRPTACPRCHSA